MNSGRSDTPSRVPGFPIRTSTDQRSVDNSPWLIAVTHVLHRSQAPRHPPLALHSLEKQDARARYTNLKQPPATTHNRQATQHTTRITHHRPEPRQQRKQPPNPTQAGPRGRLLLQNRRENLTSTPTRNPRVSVRLLRKEVIQPHLPVRLPCYDFTPIADPTFDGSLPTGWATGFGCCRLSWCDGRCVQGPGTYSPRRC